jgi:PhnB protein
MIKAIPEGYRTLTPYLVLADANAGIEFYKRALGAAEVYRLQAPDGKIGHAELTIGDSRLMLADEAPEYGAKSPRAFGGCPIGLYVYVSDVDAAAQRFLAAGGSLVRPVETQFYGDRSGQFDDPEGYRWTLSQHVEDVSPEEMDRRARALYGE